MNEESLVRGKAELMKRSGIELAFAQLNGFRKENYVKEEK